MSKTARYREQHAEAEMLIRQIASELDPTRLSTDASGVRRLLSSLAGKLAIHLKIEDECLYPMLAKHTDPKLRSLALSFQQEMGTLFPAFKEYTSRWPSPLEIQKNAQAFTRETKEIFAALRRRIERENTQLYTAVDSAG